MSVTFTTNLAEFQRDLRKAIAISNRTAAESLNARGYFVALKAMNATKRADKAAIMALGLTEYNRLQVYGKNTKKAGQLKFDKDGRIKYVKKTDYAALDYAFVNLLKRVKIHGKNSGRWAKQKFSSRSELQEAARRWLTGKIRAINFLASTWRPALRSLQNYAKVGSANAPGNKHKEVKATVRPARESWNPVLEFGMSVGADSSGTDLRNYAELLLTKSAEIGFAQEHKAMQEHIEKEMKRKFKAAGAKVL